MNTHIHRTADRALTTVPNGKNLGGRDPTRSPDTSALPTRPAESLQSTTPANPQRQKKKPSRFDFDTIAIWLFLILLAIASLLAAFQLWAKLHPH